MINHIKDREEWVDCLKALGVLLIVSHHAGLSIFNTSLYYVVIFFIISGYLFKDKSAKEFILNKVKRLYIPFVVANALALIIHNLFYYIGIISSCYSAKELIINSIKILLFDIPDLLCAPSWFIFALFVVNIVFLFLFKLCKIFKKYQDFALLIISIIMLVIGLLYKDMFNMFIYANCSIITVVFVSIIFMYLGYILKKYNVIKYLDNHDAIRLIIVLVAIISLIIVTNCFSLNIDYRAGQFSSAKLFLLVSIDGFLILRSFSSIIIKSNAVLSRVFNYIGKNTLDILLWHGISFNVITLIQIKLFNVAVSSISNWCNFYNVGCWRYFAALSGIIFPLITHEMVRLVRYKVNNK